MRPFPILMMLFLAVPIAEMYVLISVGGQIGALWTIALVVLTAVIGAALVRSQGISTLSRIQGSAAQGMVPGMELAEGVAILFAGALLLTPGFITDTVGFLCLTPPVRRGFIRGVLSKMIVSTAQGRPSAGAGSGRKKPDGPTVIEGEYTREE